MQAPLLWSVCHITIKIRLIKQKTYISVVCISYTSAQVEELRVECVQLSQWVM